MMSAFDGHTLNSPPKNCHPAAGVSSASETELRMRCLELAVQAQALDVVAMAQALLDFAAPKKGRDIDLAAAIIKASAPLLQASRILSREDYISVLDAILSVVGEACSERGGSASYRGKGATFGAPSGTSVNA